jgi:hypothetical protein
MLSSSCSGGCEEAARSKVDSEDGPVLRLLAGGARLSDSGWGRSTSTLGREEDNPDLICSSNAAASDSAMDGTSLRSEVDDAGESAMVDEMRSDRFGDCGALLRRVARLKVK